MNRKTIILGAVFAAFLMLMIPSISAVNTSLIKQSVEEECNICSHKNSAFCDFIQDVINMFLQTYEQCIESKNIFDRLMCIWAIPMGLIFLSALAILGGCDIDIDLSL